MIDKVAIGKNIRTQRDLIGMSQEELSKRMGIKRNSLAKYETGAVYIPVPTLIKLADILSCSLDVLFGLSDDVGINPSMVFFCKRIRNLNVDNREIMFCFIEAQLNYFERVKPYLKVNRG